MRITTLIILPKELLIIVAYDPFQIGALEKYINNAMLTIRGLTLPVEKSNIIYRRHFGEFLRKHIRSHFTYYGEVICRTEFII